MRANSLLHFGHLSFSFLRGLPRLGIASFIDYVIGLTKSINLIKEAI
jgi:hypothetical protein